MSPAPQKILDIERLRAWAVLGVIFYHYGQAYFSGSTFHFGFSTGVDLFFVISGFVVTRSFLSGLKNHTAFKLIGSFYWRRIFRIFPLTLSCLLVFYLIYLLLPFGDFLFIPKALKGILTLRFNYWLAEDSSLKVMGFFWTLMVEEHFYLVVPWLLVFLKTNLQRALFSLVSILVVWFLLRPLTPTERYQIFATHCRMDFLFLGLLLATCHYPSQFLPIPLVLKGLAVGSLGFLVVTGSTFLSPPFFSYLVFVACGLLVFIASLDRNLLKWNSRLDPLLIYLGSRSFGLYIWGCCTMILWDQLREKIPQFNGTLVIVEAVPFVLTLVTCELSYRLIERPLNHWARNAKR